ncbi:NmrA-like family protein [Whalleya microplaca]|nr:NmrA-like family protein [Whalleya microplaca]
MAVVAVAGGLGDMGRLTTKELMDIQKYEVYSLSRRLPSSHPEYTSPLSGKTYFPVLQTNYGNEDALVELFTQYNVHTVICTFAMDFQDASDAQLRLIRAAQRAPCVKRFIPSEFNIDYDLPDDILPYPEKRFHIVARRELEKTALEYTYIYPGMFMDYFGMPNIQTHLRELCIVLDPTNRKAVIPGDGNAKMSMSFTKDVARYTALALELETWPKVLKTVNSTVTLNQLLALVEENLGYKLDVTYESVEKLKRHETDVLPRNVPIADQFPGGMAQLKALISDLEASIALGAYDLDDVEGSLDLVKTFQEKTEPLMTIEKLMQIAWKPQ